MESVSIEQIQESLDEFTISVDSEDVLYKMQELCIVYRMSAEDIASAWTAFFSTKQLEREPTLDSLAQFEREELSRQKAKTKPTQQTPKQTPGSRRSMMQESPMSGGYKDSNSPTSMYATPQRCRTADVSPTLLDDDILCQYSSPAAMKKRVKTPESSGNKRQMMYNGMPKSALSPRTTSSTATTPSRKYNSRSERGSIVQTYGKTSDVPWKCSEGAQCEIEAHNGFPTLKNYPYMFEKLRQRASVLNWLIMEIGDQLKERLNIEEWASLAAPTPGEMVVLGRVCSEGDGKLNATSLWLEGSQGTSSGKAVQLDIEGVHNVSLFPGKIIAIRGVQVKDKILVKEIHEASMPPQPQCEFSAPSADSGLLQVVVAAGPFTTSDTLSYEPLSDLLDYVCEHKPHVLILIGPFVDAKHEMIKKSSIAETHSDMFDRHINEIQQRLSHVSTQVVLIPSVRDVHHDYIYPTPPFKLKNDYKNVHCFPDPCILHINGFVIGVSSTDILFHLGREELMASFRNPSDRMSRLCHHILTQQSFYPLYPPSEELNVDFEHFDLFAQLDVTPHIMILPSELKGFIKEVDGCCFLNPERLTKGQVGGSFARIAVKASAEGQVVPEIAVEILKI